MTGYRIPENPLHIAHMIDSLHVGGAEKLQVLFAAAARQRGLCVTVLCLSNDYDTPIPKELRALGIQVLTFPGRGLLDLERIVRIAAALRRMGCAVLQTHLAYANIIGVLAGRLAGVPVVGTLHSTADDPVHHSRIPRAEAWALRYGARRIVAVGHTVMTAHHEQLRGHQIEVIFNPVAPVPALDLHERAALRVALVGDDTRPLLITAGRLVALKGYHDLLAALVTVRAAHPRVALAIIGSGPQHDDLAAQIAANGLNDHGLLLGRRDDVPRLLAAADIYVNASHVEGLPMAVLEAMAAGLPVVATNVGDMPHLLADGLGVIVPPRQPKMLAEALVALLDDLPRARAMGAQARDHVAQHYSVGAWMDRLLAVYADVSRQPDIVSQELS